jgi:eukaryotic-like serine/threonine-protein kinase
VDELAARLDAALSDTYHIERELGGGTASRLFLAVERALDRRVVIKVLPPDSASDVSAARFKREIALAAQLQHPHILPVLTAGSQDDLLYYVMPYLEGESLRHRLQRDGRLPVDDAVTILGDVADALAVAHAAGVVHRDVKPGNILLQGNSAVLMDFGVARALEEARGGRRLTDPGTAVGTPGYMSPEQAVGESQVDARSDVYALAVVGYEMLAGSPPFSGLTLRAMVAAHLAQVPKPLGQVRSDVPSVLSDAISKGLAKDPADRFQTAAAFRDALPTPVGARPQGRRSGLRALAAGLVALTGWRRGR